MAMHTEVTKLKFCTNNVENMPSEMSGLMTRMNSFTNLLRKIYIIDVAINANAKNHVINAADIYFLHLV